MHGRKVAQSPFHARHHPIQDLSQRMCPNASCAAAPASSSTSTSGSGTRQQAAGNRQQAACNMQEGPEDLGEYPAIRLVVVPSSLLVLNCFVLALHGGW